MGEGRRQLLMVSMLLSIVTVFSKLVGFIKEQIIAHSFGVSAVTDAFVSAQFLPSILDSLISASLGIVLVPLFTEALGHTKEAASRLLYSVLCAVAAFYALYVGFLWGSASYLLRAVVPGLSSEAIDVAVGLTRVFAPSAAFLGLIAVMNAFLNVHTRFLLTALAATAANISVVIAYMVYGGALTVQHLAWAIVLGYVSQTLILAARLRGLVVPFSRSLDWAGLRRVGTLMAPLVFSTMIWMITPVMDKFLASRMEAGSMASLNYAFKLIQLPVGMITSVVSTVVYTRFARLASEKRLMDLGNEVARTLQALLFGLLPVTVILMMVANPVVSIAFQRGRFDYQAVRATADALVYYSVGLVPMAGLPVLTMALFSVKNTRSHVLSNSMAVVTYVLGALSLAGTMNQRGLALAYSVGQTMACIVVAVVLTRVLGTRPFLAVLKSLPRTMVASCGAAVAIWFASRWVDSTLALIGSALVVGSTIYLTAHFFMKSQEIVWLLLLVKHARNRLVGPSE